MGQVASLAGRVAIVTGASRGIGAATARSLAEAGARVVLAARPSADLDDAAGAIPGALAVPCDVRSEDAVRAMVERTVATFGQVDVLVNGAGLGRFAPVAEASLADWDEMLAVNLRGTFVSCQAVLPHLLANPRGGNIFNLASVAAIRPFAGAAAYCASKWGVLGFSRVLAEEVRRLGVKVTAIIAGATDTPFWDAAGGTDLSRQAMLRPEDVARAIVFVTAQPPEVYTDEMTLMPPGGVL